VGRTVDRREFLRRLALTGGVFAAASAGALYFRGREPRARGAADTLRDHREGLAVDRRMVVLRGPDPAALVERGFEAMGGAGAFIRRGERVLIKPNMAWDRTPEQGANTHPLLVAAAVRTALAAGAASVVVADVPCNDPVKVLERSGIRKAAAEAGARVAVPSEGPEVDFGGAVIARFAVGREFLEADRIINMPVVKVHSLSGITCGMKNWYGLLVGRRHGLHQNIDESIADLAAAAKPTLTIIDATRIMVSNGPTGGAPSDVVRRDLVAFTTDEVAGDAWAADLLGRRPGDLPFLGLAAGRGLGTGDWRSILQEEVSVGT